MKAKIGVLFLGIGIISVAAFIIHAPKMDQEKSEDTPDATEALPSPLPLATSDGTTTASMFPDREVIAENLKIPWDIAFLPDGSMLVSERPGNLFLFAKDGTRTAIDVPDVRSVGEAGLLGITLHPDFGHNKIVYLYVTIDENGQFLNRILRYTLENNTLTNKQIILTKIPGAQFHDGGRMDFGPDGMLYITTGDARNEKSAQDTKSLAGKILRIRDDGSIPADNPFGNEVYSYGHRNPQGLAWDSEGRLWATEHGRTTATLTGMDEINLIEKGKNYGWPDIEGDKTAPNMVVPVLNSGADETWAPASAAYLNGYLYFGGLRGETLYRAKILGNTVELSRHLVKKYGRIRAVRVGPDNMLYISTSNQDGRGTVHDGDDKIIRINPDSLE